MEVGKPSSALASHAVLRATVLLHGLHLRPLCHRRFWRVDFGFCFLLRILLCLSVCKRLIYRLFKKFIDLSYGTFAIVVCEHRNLICIKIKRKKCKNGMKNDTVLRKSSYLCIVKRQVGI